MATKIARPDPLTFHTPRAFLRDYLEYLKAEDPKFSLRKLSEAAGLANGFLPMFLSGKRNFSMQSAQRILRHLKLDARESKYFLLISELALASTPEIRLEILDRLHRMEIYQEKNSKEFEVHQYLKRWYYVAIRELSLLSDFTDDPQWIKKRLRGRMTLNEIKVALQFLKEHEFIQQKDGVFFKNDDKEIDCLDGIFKISLSTFHRQMLELTADSIDQINGKQRIVLGNTMPLRNIDVAEVQRILSNALDQIQALEPKDGSGDEVYHFVVAGFPLTQNLTHEDI